MILIYYLPFAAISSLSAVINHSLHLLAVSLRAFPFVPSGLLSEQFWLLMFGLFNPYTPATGTGGRYATVYITILF
jgi:hypothetical protein